MRYAVRYVCLALAVAAVAIACGGTDGSVFVDPNANADGGPFEPPPGTFVPTADAAADGGACTPLTCADLKANCGPVGDGCGGLVQCGDCGVGETCGGGGTASTCGKPPCKPKTCADLGVDCGPQGDGCGGSLACGTCDAGICGGGGPSKCGTGGLGDGGVCVPTKTTCAAGDCGPIGDGCGNSINCSPPAWPACPAGQTCGGGGTASLCGAPPCTKKTCGTQNCGYIADGCGGQVNCWPPAPAVPVCGPGQSCGGAGVANTCGTPAGCTGLCTQQVTCPGGGTTSIEGYVTSPNGVLPVPNAVVYVPNGAVAAFTAGVKCETCATASGSPLITTTTDANGHFLLPNMPVSDPAKVTNIPVVVQLGKWRKQFTIATTACVNNKVPAFGMATADKTAALPANKAQGDIPLTAISTGAVDGLECVFRKMGVDDAEFTDGNGTGRIRLYQDNGAVITAGSPKADKLYCPLGKSGTGTAGGGCGTNCPAGGPCTVNEIDKYDAVIFGCVASQVNKGTTPLQNVLAYANKGGRVFGTHFSYVWLNSATTWSNTATSWAPGTRSWNNTAAPGSLSAFIDTSFPKGVLFSTWLQAPVAPVSATYPAPYAAVNGLYASSPPTLALTEPRKDINPTANLSTSGIVPTTVVGGVTQPLGQRWVYSSDDNGAACVTGATCDSKVCTAGKCVGSVVFDPANDPAAADAPLHYTFNTPTTAASAAQCGRVLYSDFHVSIGNTNGQVFPAECNNTALTAQEKVLAYFLFDLASCVSTTAPPACVPKTCMQQGLGCGLAGDGCGGPLDCGACTSGTCGGQTCGGGGVPSQCGAPACVKKTCVKGVVGVPDQCGLLGDGCGCPLDCGPCTKPGDICGGGGANLCGAAACVPTGCPAPAAGSVCGPVADGCGKVNNCPCAAGVPCVNGLCNAPACTKKTCQAGQCGLLGDGCGGTLDCGMCAVGTTCGGGGIANYCGGGPN